MLHRGHRTWTPYVDPLPDKENALLGLPLKTPVRHAHAGKHHTLNGKAGMMLGKQAPMTGGKGVGGSQTAKGKEKEAGVLEGKRAPMTVFKDRNLVLTGKKNGVSERGGRDAGENNTFGIKKLDFKPAGSSTAAAGPKPKSKLNQQVSLIPSPAPDDGFSALPVQTPFFGRQQARTSLGGGGGGGGGAVDSTPLPSATRSRRRSSRHSGTPLGSSPHSLRLPGLTSTPAPTAHLPASTSFSNLLAPTPLDKSFITPARPSYRAYVSPPEYEMEEGEMSGRDEESFEMGDLRARVGGLGVVDELEGEVGVDAGVEVKGEEDVVESDGEVEYMPPKVVALPDVIPFDFVPLKTLGEQLTQIKSDYFIAYSDSDDDDDAYTHVERRWNLELGKHELLAGGWEGDEEVKPARGGALKRLELRPESEFDNPIFAALKCNQPRVSGHTRRAVPATTQTRRPMTTVQRPVPGQQSRTLSAAAPGQQRPATVIRRPVTSTTSRPRALTSRALTTTVPARRERVPMSSATDRSVSVSRPTLVNGSKQAIQRSATVRPALGQVRANVKPAPVKEALLHCEDIGFDV
ncbi:hypothetical protein NliqN6_2682 [Naganishia liquefaciens]|uniref:Uncharacterized protein n=1 Tax=Naganishia liquefaciens TaxID=104408 RepID=A0A8H3TTB0_9TREE|nr:hypothetical protein NliqN6_2682 [Naganishia liquefaciens]